MRVNRLFYTLIAVLLSIPTWPGAASAQRRGQQSSGPPKAEEPPPLRFHYIGPHNAGRLASFTGIPGDTTTYYIGAASGGIWKSSDGAKTFAPVFDDQNVQAIGALAVAPSDPSIVWAGTGEAWAIRDADIIGNGVYKSEDAGAHWQHMGLPNSRRIGSIIVHPTDPNTVYVCALGQLANSGPDRGVFRTRDGGKTWQRVLYVNPTTGCSGLSMDAHDPNVLVAGTWQVQLRTWAMSSGGAGSGVYLTRDGGTTWKRIENAGLPKSPYGKVDVAIAPSDSRRVYALIETKDQGSLWRSDDGGQSWNVASWDRRLIGRAGYYINVDVNPVNENEVLVASSSFHRSLDGGRTFSINDRGCGDCHAIWMDPLNPDHWATTGDGGVGITLDHAKSFRQVSLPVGQMYHVAVDQRTPYWVYSNRQDDGTMRGPSDTPVPVPNVPSYYRGFGVGTGVPGGEAAPVPRAPGMDRSPFGTVRPEVGWEGGLGGCESGFTIPQPDDTDIIWATCYGNKVTRYDARTGVARTVTPWRMTLDSPPNEIKYRCHWTPPLAIDPFDPHTVYYGCQVIFRTSDAGETWSVISPDLSRRDSSRIISSGGVIADNLGQFYGELVFAIAPSAAQKGLIWAGTNDGKVWYTSDAGAHWNDVTANIKGIPAWGTVRKIEPSVFDASTAYVTVDAHLIGDRAPYIFKTSDMGKTWTKISGSLPADSPLSYVMSFAENPNRRGMLFAGTGHGFYYSLDDGGSWTHFDRGLPAAPVSWIMPQKLYHDVVISTYGRGLFVLRDITTLEQSDKVVADAPVHLYQPRAGIRHPRDGSAEFLYALKATPRKQAELEILDSRDSVIRKIKAESHVGLNRVKWDLLYDPPRQVALRTKAPDNPHIWEEGPYVGKETRPVVHWGIQGPQRTGPIAAPGKYKVRLKVDDSSYVREFEVVKDPVIRSSDADIAASTETQVKIRTMIDTTADMINRIEKMREQIEQRLSDSTNGAAAALHALDSTMLRVEHQLIARAQLQSDDKFYVEKPAIYLQLLWLSGEVGLGAGDVAGGADYRPTAQSLDWVKELETALAGAKSDFTKLLTSEVPAFNERMKGKVEPISTTDKKEGAGKGGDTSGTPGR
jgi:photosystem II stability/assembly factor-like uncharacterized protein